MELSDKGVVFITNNEGLRLQAYRDGGGVPTIGYGHTKGVKMGDVCTKEQALAYLHDDTKEAVSAVNDLVKIPITQDQFDALVDFVFNIGRPQFASSTLLRVLNSGDYFAASKQFGRWKYDNGKEVAGLIARRKRTADMFLHT
jgi:lysozyme